MLATFVFSANVSFGQIKKPKTIKEKNSIPNISLGRLKLGVCIDDLPELKSENIIKVNSLNIVEYYENENYKDYNKEGKNYEFNHDTITIIHINPIENPILKNERVFLVKNLQISDNITLNNVHLRFFNDFLYHIELSSLFNDYTNMRNSEAIPENFIDAITIKYGNPKLDVEKKDIVFQNGYGAKFTKTERHYTETWFNTNDNISMWLYTGFLYTDDGKEFMSRLFQVYNVKTKNKVDRIKSKLREKLEKQKENEKKNKFKDF